jgi:SAM-dependent methyltransferase
MFYRLKVLLLKSKWLNLRWQNYRRRKGDKIGNYNMLPDFIRKYAPGKSFVDVGCMWGVNGEYAFIAEEAGATRVLGIDVFGPTPEFLDKKKERNSNVEFLLGDALSSSTIRKVGERDVVFCAGVLYHLPSPYELLISLRRMCKETLILRSSTIPERKDLKNMAVFWPMLDEKERNFWSLKSLGLLHQEGISNAFSFDAGYGNWFWGLTPSCLKSLLQLAGFEVVEMWGEAFAQTVICKAVSSPFMKELPSEEAAAAEAITISKAGIARPA